MIFLTSELLYPFFDKTSGSGPACTPLLVSLPSTPPAVIGGSIISGLQKNGPQIPAEEILELLRHYAESIEYSAGCLIFIQIWPVVQQQSADRDFLIKVHQLVAERCHDPVFGVAALCRALKLSQPQLHRKLKALTGVSPSRFIRQRRLECALVLLLHPGLTIAEVAYDAGFSSPGYFARVFQQEYGMTPTRYRSKMQDQLQVISQR